MADITPGKTTPTSSGGRELLPTGKYLVNIKHVEKTLSPNGKERLSWQFSIKAGEYKNRVIFDDTYLTDAALWKVQSLAAAAGLKPEQTFDPGNAAQLIDLFVGRELFVSLGEDKYTNSEGAQVVTRKVTAYDSTTPSVPKPREGGNKGAEAGDDIPF